MQSAEGISTPNTIAEGNLIEGGEVDAGNGSSGNIDSTQRSFWLDIGAAIFIAQEILLQ